MNWQEGEAPEGWTLVPLNEVSKVTGGGTPKTNIAGNFSDDSGHPWITPADLTNYTEKRIRRGRRFLTDQGLASSSAKILPAGTVLFSSRAPIGYVAIADTPVATNQGFRSFTPGDRLDSDYLYYALQFLRPVAEQLASGTTFPEISGSKAGLMKIAFPDIPQQRAIASLLDRTQELNHNALAHLSDAQRAVKRFRQVLLADACSGQLTADWRANHPITTSPSNKMSLEGKSAKSHTAIAEFDPEPLPVLPDTWQWVPLAAVSDGVLGKMLDKAKNKGEMLPYLRNVNVRWRSFDLADMQRMRFEDREGERYGLRQGDVIVCEGGEPGRAAVWRETVSDMRFQKALHRVRCHSTLAPDWLVNVLQAHAGSGLLPNYFTGSGIAHLTGVSLARVPIPLPPIEEQKAIVALVENLWTLADQVESQILISQDKIQRTTQAVLAKGFSGELIDSGSERH